MNIPFYWFLFFSPSCTKCGKQDITLRAPTRIQKYHILTMGKRSSMACKIVAQHCVSSSSQFLGSVFLFQQILLIIQQRIGKLCERQINYSVKLNHCANVLEKITKFLHHKIGGKKKKKSDSLGFLLTIAECLGWLGEVICDDEP